MHTLHTLSTAPVRAAIRLQTLRSEDGEAGMASAEYAVATVAACGFGGILWKLLQSEAVLTLLTSLFRKALGTVV